MKKPKISEDELVKPDQYNYTLEEIAAEVGISRPQVSNIIERALGKIRRELFRRAIEKDDII
jgi:DNA-directed RNA polymerase specialized sigma subunit